MLFSNVFYVYIYISYTTNKRCLPDISMSVSAVPIETDLFFCQNAEIRAKESAFWNLGGDVFQLTFRQHGSTICGAWGWVSGDKGWVWGDAGSLPWNMAMFIVSFPMKNDNGSNSLLFKS